MSKVKEKIDEIIEKYYSIDLRNAASRDMLASEIAAEFDEDFQMPITSHPEEERRKQEAREKGIFEKYLENPSDDMDMNTGANREPIPQVAVEAMKENRKPRKTPVVNRKKVEKPKPKPEMSDFFDNPEMVNKPKRKVNKPIEEPKPDMGKEFPKTETPPKSKKKKSVPPRPTKKSKLKPPKRPRGGFKNLGGKK